MAASLVKNDPGKVETSKLWNEMRAWKDKNYPQCMLVSEWADPTVAIPAGFNIDFMIHFGVPGYGSLFFDRNTPWGKLWPGQKETYKYCYFDKAGKGGIEEFVTNYSHSYFTRATRVILPSRRPITTTSVQTSALATRQTS